MRKGAIAVALLAYYYAPTVTWYQLSSAAQGVKILLSLSREDIRKCTEAYDFMGKVSMERMSNTEEETEHVRAYYKVINPLLAIADIEKMYIPPQIDPKKGLYENQLIWERMVKDTLQAGKDSKLLDVGCGRGRISHHMATMTGGKVSGFNIDESQIQSAREYAEHTGLSQRLDFKIGDHHKRFDYEDASFDGAYSFQAMWPFFKPDEIDHAAKELFRVLKPGGRYSCGEYLLSPQFDREDKEHMALHRLFLPTLAATQSNYPAEVTDALQRAGFKIIQSAPSIAPAWPLTDQKTDLFHALRFVVNCAVKVGFLPDWIIELIDNLLKGGIAWADAEKMKIADLNWRIVAEKPK